MKTLIKTWRQFKLNRCFFMFILVLEFLIGFVLVTDGYAQKSIIIPYDGTIVIDPGHGGHDSGTQGTGGMLEKTVALTLARYIKAEVDEKYKVILTRTDDYWLDIPERTAVANHALANLFISLHTGGSFLHQASGQTVYYFEELYKPMQTLGSTESGQEAKKDLAVDWDQVQKQHIHASRNFAKLLQNRLNNGTKEQICDLQGAPLVVLRGADMPAVVIEVGYLTNPVEENQLANTDDLKKLAEIISRCIHEFLEKQLQAR